MICSRKKLKAVGCTLLLTTAFTEQAFALPAFPGAEGSAAETVGGRGGRVIEVTNLNGSGPGSLREAAEASGPRTVVFKVSGIIDLEGESISIANPYITIAGQTAPEGGITIKGHELSIRTHDVVVRFLKIRTGTDYPLADQVGDAIGMIGKGDLYNNIIDHVSMSWAHDENAQVWSWSTDTAPHNITYSWNIMSEGLDGHSTGFIAGSYENTKDFKDVTLHNNLFANTSHRLPLIKIASAKVINNLVYNWKHYATGIKGGAHLDVIANKYKPGPETSSSKNQEVAVENLGYGDPAYPRSGAPGYASIFVKGNIGPHQSDENADNWGMVFHRNTDGTRPPLERSTFERTTAQSKYKYPITIKSIADTEKTVLQDAGASRRINENGQWVTNRGEVDSRIINDYKNGTGFIPVDENEVGGYPVIPFSTPYTDSDHDGMADVWEDSHGFDKDSASDNIQDKDGDGYTNVEEFINATNPNGTDDATVSAPAPTTDPIITEPVTEVPTGDKIIQSRVSASSDDAEELSNGSMYLNSSDLELVEEGSAQTVGIRFSALAIPANATVTKAYIQFQADETDSAANTVVNIAGESTANAAGFTNTSYNISDRAVTNASVSWTPADWNSIGAAAAEQRTSDLTSVVQEIISGAGWENGNAMAFIFTGSGKRVAEAYDGDQAGAPQLYIEYTTNETVNDPVTEPTNEVVNDTVADTTAPVITLTGASTMILKIGDTFSDPGATAMDDTDRDLTSSIQNNSDVDTASAGTYQVTYTVTDSSGNFAETTRTVVVNNETSEQYSLQSRVSASADDAEESVDGSMYLNSSDLEMALDNDQQVTGLRFNNLSIPENAIISKAYIQFQTDETDFLPNTVLNIVGESTNDALGFDNAEYNISDRAQTNASVSWSPAEWNTIGATGADQSTSDLTAIVQEIVSESGWYNGNSMAFIITGTGKRVAESYDGNKDGAPLLYVEYSY